MGRNHERHVFAGIGGKESFVKSAPSISQYWNNALSIRARLGLGVGLLLVLTMIITGTILIGRFMLNRAEVVLSKNIEIQRLVLDMERGMEKARWLYGEFFLHAPEIGFAEAHEQYAHASARQGANVITLSKALQELVGEGIHFKPVEVNLYLSFAQRFADTSIEAVELFAGLHSPDMGLEPQLNQVLAEIRAALNTDGEPSRLFMEMKSHIQEYRITRQRPQMQAAFNVELLLRKSLRNDPSLDDHGRQKIESLLDRARELAEKILVAEVAIRSLFNDLVIQAATVDDVSITLEKLASEEVKKSQQRIRHVRMTVVLIVVALTLTGIVAALLVAWMINRFVIQRVARLTRFAGELREGNLEVEIPEDSGDELGQLARTFNCMTVRIRELVNTLELKVEQRTAELSASEWRFRQLFENSSNGVMILEACEQGDDFIIRDCNKSALTMEQRTREELIGRRVTETSPGIREIGLLAVMQSVWKTGQPARTPVRLYVDERLRGWREYAVYRLSPAEIVCVYIDRTARMQAEEEKQGMEVKLQRARKMEALGLMAGGVAHDLNNILSGIVGFPDILLMNLPQDSSLRKPVEVIKDSGQRAAAVVADLLTVARGAAGRRENVGLNGLVQGYLASPEYLALGARHPLIDCESLLDPNLPPILCSPVHISKCIMNLVSNAMESIDGPGRVALSTGREIVTEPLARQNNVNPGEYAVLRVSDSGRGIKDKDLEHIFEPFYSKKIMGVSGTGLGLAVVWNSVADHGGMIRVESGSRGTTFFLYFPLSTQLLEEKRMESAPIDLSSRGEKILVVDDEAMLRELAVTLLQRLGYAVSCVASGEQAIAYLREHSVDLVVLDMMMEPGINGLETYRRILSFAPLQKAIIVSGFAESDDVKAVQALGAKRFVKKPYVFEQLGRAVREELDGVGIAGLDN
jgi:signal transduction histidine kinase/ActR/RegA family two-component response regulator/HAMP domain-containing protein